MTVQVCSVGIEMRHFAFFSISRSLDRVYWAADLAY